MNTSELYSKEAEDNIIGILLIDSDLVPRIISQLTEHDFYQPKLRVIFKAITELQKQSKIIDIVTVSELIKFNNQLDYIGGRSTINELAEGVITTSNYKQLIKVIIKYSKKRSIINVCKEAIANLENSSDVNDVAIQLSKQASDILLRTTDTKLQTLSAGVIEMMDNVERLISNESGTLGLATGFEELDNNLSGLCPGRLYLLGARPSMGKSMYAQQIAEHIALTKNVVFFSLEMSTEEYTQRSIYRRSGYNQEHLTRGIIPREKILDAFAAASVELNDLKLYIVDEPKCTLTTIERNIQECISKYGSCDCIIVDYLQLMASDNKNVIKDYDIVTDNSQGLKQIARKYRIPVLVLSQLSRQLEGREDKRPILSDLRDSGAIEQDADVVTFLHREEVYRPNDIRLRGKAEVIIAKNRQGRRGVIIPMTFNGPRLELKEAIVEPTELNK